MSPLELSSTSEDDTLRIGRRLGELIEGGILIGLDGELGSGKTCLVRGLALGLKIPPDEVSSPTFVICHVYQGRLTLLHVDVYRLRQVEEYEELGVAESLDRGAAVVVEWSERVAIALPPDRIQVRIDDSGEFNRKLTIEARGARSQRVLEKW